VTRLFIDGQEVVLPDDLSLTVIEENPFLTKNGEYTYDITLSLMHSTNAKIYQHCNRLNNSYDLPSSRKAVLISDNHLILNGTEIIINISDTAVKIQLVSGNSELNYFIGDDKIIRNLDLGSATRLTTNALICSSLDQGYPSRDWQLIPFMTNDSDVIIGNGYFYYYYPAGYDPTYNDVLRFAGIMPTGDGGVAINFKQRPQPYLCFILKQIIASFGYTIEYNAIAEHSIWKNAVIIQGYDTMEYAKMLPDWTVAKFLENIEKFFCCTVVVNSQEKKVNIYFNSYPLEAEDFEEINIVDEYDADIDNDNDILEYKNTNIGYSLDSEDYYSLKKLSDSIKNLATVSDTILLDVADLVSDDTDADRFKKIFHDTETDTDFIAYDDGSVIPKVVDSFKNLMNNPDDDDSVNLELNIIPASFKTMKVSRTYYTFSNDGSTGTAKNYYLQIPVVENYDPLIQSSDDDYTIQGLAVGDDSINSRSLNSKLRLVLYAGRQEVDLEGITDQETIDKFEKFPTCFVESLPEYYSSDHFPRDFLNGINPFRIKWLYENMYEPANRINVSKKYPFTFIDRKVNIKKPFLIRNRKYICEKIERSITIEGIKTLSKGYFYQIEN